MGKMIFLLPLLAAAAPQTGIVTIPVSGTVTVMRIESPGWKEEPSGRFDRLAACTSN